MALPVFGFCAGEAGGSAWRSHQERKLRLLKHWRDAAERQLAALDASIRTLQQQMDRDAAARDQAGSPSS